LRRRADHDRGPQPTPARVAPRGEAVTAAERLMSNTSRVSPRDGAKGVTNASLWLPVTAYVTALGDVPAPTGNTPSVTCHGYVPLSLHHWPTGALGTVQRTEKRDVCDIVTGQWGRVSVPPAGLQIGWPVACKSPLLARNSDGTPSVFWRGSRPGGERTPWGGRGRVHAHVAARHTDVAERHDRRW
jgi:hypothetical protein